VIKGNEFTFNRERATAATAGSGAGSNESWAARSAVRCNRLLDAITDFYHHVPAQITFRILEFPKQPEARLLERSGCALV
jgi:hypothetical protein